MHFGTKENVKLDIVFESQAVSSNCKSVEHDVHLKWIGDAI